MIKFKLIFFVIFSLNVHLAVPSISDKRLCANQNCSELISVARTLIRYSSPDSRILSFAPNVEVKVFSKSAGSNMDLWGVEINGKRGYVNKKLIREFKIFKNQYPYLVDTEPLKEVNNNNNEVPSDKATSEQIVPNKVQEQYEIIDGTTINLVAPELIKATSLRNLVEPTATFQVNNPVEDSVDQDNKNENKPTESPLNNSDEKSTFVKIESESEINSKLEHLAENSNNDITINEGVNVLDEKSSLDSPNNEHEATNNSLLNPDDENVASDDIKDENDDDDEDEDSDEEDSDDDSDNKDEEQQLNIPEKASELENNNNSFEKPEFSNNLLDINSNNNSVDSNLPADNKTLNIENSDVVVIKDELENESIKSRNLLNVADIDSSTELGEDEGETRQETIKLNAFNTSAESIDELKGLNSESKTIIDSSKILTEEVKPETAESESNNFEIPKLPSETNEQIKYELVTESSVDELIYPHEIDTDVTPNPLESNSAVNRNGEVQENIENNFVSEKMWDNKIAGEQEIIQDALAKENVEINETVVDDKEAAENKDSQASVIHNALSDETERTDNQIPISSEESQESYLETQEPDRVVDENKDVLFDEMERTDNQIPISSEESQESYLETQEPDRVVDESKDEALGVDEDRELLSSDLEDYESCSADKTECTYDPLITPTEDVKIETELHKEFDPVAVLNEFNSDFINLFTIMGITGVSIVLFLLGYVMIDKSRKEGPLIAKINNLEKSLLIAVKENQLLTDRISEVQNEEMQERESISNEMYAKLELQLQEALNIRRALEEQIQSLEKELENSTEVGLELNRMLSDILSSQNGSDILIANVEQLQRQLVEQQSTINSINAALNLKDTENHELQLELEINNKKVIDLQTELDKMVLNILKIEEEKEQLQNKLDNDEGLFRKELEKTINNFNSERKKLVEEVNLLKNNSVELQRNLELKNSEYVLFKETVNQIKAVENDSEILKSVLETSSIKAQLQHLQQDNQTLTNLLHQEKQARHVFENQAEQAMQETQRLKAQYDEADKEKLEARTKLEVLSSYFKDREAQLQKELHKQESMWVEKQGEATSTIERIKYMQEELQNCKAQNESLKQEIVSQEVELKSQISVLEKKSHESWVAARQAERKLEDARQEAMQLRNRLTLKERSFIEDKGQKRIQSPLEQNGELPTSPLHLPVESPASPPLLYGTRDHMTTSPPVPGLPPFLPPPPGIRFMPAFMPPPPPTIFPVDHRPPPLGRMSSPPHNSRYSPNTRYSPYDRNSPSPPYDDDYVSSSPPPPLPLHRGYSPYNSRDDRKDYKRPPPVRNSGRNKGAVSSDSANSNESLEKINRHH